MSGAKATIIGAAYPVGNRDGSDSFDLTFTKAKNTPMVKLRVKVWQGKDTPAIYHDVLVFGEQAERVCDSLTAGDRIVAVGKWKPNEWTKRDGTVVKSETLFADDVAVALRWSSVTVRRDNRGSRATRSAPAKAAPPKPRPDEAPF